jgi:hypothetical protein
MKAMRIKRKIAANGPNRVKEKPDVYEKTDKPILSATPIPILIALPPRPGNFLVNTNLDRPTKIRT